MTIETAAPHQREQREQGQPGSSEKPARRVALVTGGTGGLGEAVVRSFLERGCAVMVPYHSNGGAERLRTAMAEAGTAASGEEALLTERADLTRAADVERVVQAALGRFGRIDYLLNLVGGWAGGAPLWETDDAAFDQMLDLNLRSVFVTCRAVVPVMLRQRFGRIVNVSSRTARQPAPRVGPYAISKMGVVTLTETLALELATQGADVTANCVLPSVIDTPANRRSMPKADPSRWVRTEQLAAVIAWLTGPDAAPINGASIPVYGRA